MSRRTAILATTTFAVLLCLVVAYSLVSRRSNPGRVVRYVVGSSGAEQVMEDLAEDVRRKPELINLQSWGEQILARYTANELATDGAASYWSQGHVKLAPAEIPDEIERAWNEPPEISLRLSEQDEPDAVVIAWYTNGLLVGRRDYVPSSRPEFIQQIQPGIYAYVIER